MRSTPYLFVYGTLGTSNGKLASLIGKQGYTSLGKGMIHGTLLKGTEYPAMVSGGNNTIQGEIVELKQFDSQIRVIDDWEEYYPSHPEQSLYIRKLVNVETPKGTMPCWVYYFNELRLRKAV